MWPKVRSSRLPRPRLKCGGAPLYIRAKPQGHARFAIARIGVKHEILLQPKGRGSMMACGVREQ